MPRLQPLKVPWQISPSMPELGVTTRSFDGVNHGFVTFMGFLGEATKLHGKYGRYKQIAVILEDIVGVRFYPEFSPIDVERIESYDWTAVSHAHGSLKGYVRRFHDEWNATNICPSPSAYVVEDSDWLRELRFSGTNPHLQFQHYLFIGDDYQAEVIAKSMRWEIVGLDGDDDS